MEPGDVRPCNLEIGALVGEKALAGFAARAEKLALAPQ
jgi:hypothetical protein